MVVSIAPNANVGTEDSSNSSKSGLSLEEKKNNHIASENRRREQIRNAFDKLVDIVPELESHESRSELAVLQKTTAYLERLRQENEELNSS